MSPAPLPNPPSERGAWILAVALGALGVGVLAAVVTGLLGGSSPETPPPPPPPVLVSATTPMPGPAASASVLAARTPLAGVQPSGALTRLVRQTEIAVPARWIEGFYPIYGVAQSTFAVNWLLLASIHEQESAFSTTPGTYRGLNFAGCCGGPMQFNVTNRPVSTWQLVSNSYIYGRRPAAYDHPTATHPSIYDDFDAIMAAAHLLSAEGATLSLDGGAWDAAYAYYGHDVNGVAYADEVLARAIGWSQHGFCASCGTDQTLLTAVHAAYGAPVLAALTAPTVARAASVKGKR